VRFFIPLLFAGWIPAIMAVDAGVVLRPVANMYAKSSVDAGVVSQAIYGAHVRYLDKQPGWVKVKTPDDYEGWIEAAALRDLKEGEKAYATSGKVAAVESLFAHLYRENSVNKHQPLLTVPFETRLEVVAEPGAEGGRWLQVRLADDRPAWVQRGDLSFLNGPLEIDQVIGLARRFLGLPYTWGGTSSFGYDCSGFMQMLCRKRGVVIPRDAQPQAHWSGLTPVPRLNLRKGDLLYFGSGEQKITHTGMYIGGGEFISSTAHQRPVVRISRLDEEHWTRLFVCARRLK